MEENNYCTGIISSIVFLRFHGTMKDYNTPEQINTQKRCLSLTTHLSRRFNKIKFQKGATNTLYKQIKTIKGDDKHPIFDPAQNKVLGRDVVECDDVPDGTILFGDFGLYQFNWNKDAVIDKSAEVAFKSGDSVFRIIALLDGGLAELGGITAKSAGTSGSSSGS